MVVFKSLIVLDAETTSLPQYDHNTTKLTELALIGCEVEHLKESENLPRVLHKLVLAFNPCKLIQPGASRVSGLTNELLMNALPLGEEDVDMVRQFVSRLPQPVCLVAHNGDNFDFPILRRAIQKLNKSLPNNVYCVDAWKGFHTLIPKVEYEPGISSSKGTPSIQKTPTQQKVQPFHGLQRKKVCRELFPGDDDDDTLSQWDSTDGGNGLKTSQSLVNMPRSYRLSDIYCFYFGKYFKDSHRAEVDSNALLSCIKSCAGFLDWMNENAVVFNSIQPLF